MRQALDSNAARWHAVVTRDATAGFIYAVTTTGVFCRPGCGAPQPLRENVRYFATPALATAAGYRACKRCRPTEGPQDHPHARAVAAAASLLAEVGTTQTLAALAAPAGLSGPHFQRVFKSRTGVSPKTYAEVPRALARAARSVGPPLRVATAASTLGRVLVAASEAGLVAITLGDDDAALLAGFASRFPGASLRTDDSDFAAVVATVVAFVDQPALGLTLPLDVRGTAFQCRVWQALRAVPSGETWSYSALAAAIGLPTAARAVAAACAANTLAVAIPCHRVVRADGSLCGFRWGVARKAKLLAAERAAASSRR